jgi:hypothetical protein
MSASAPRDIEELTAVIDELPAEYGLNLIRQLPRGELPLLKAKLERLTEREPTSARERATRARLTTFLAEVRQLMPPVVMKSGDMGTTRVRPHGPSDPVGSLIRAWHPGKLVMLWAGTVGMFYARAHTADWSDLQPALGLLAVISLGISIVVTWKWLGAREAMNQKTPRGTDSRKSPEEAGSILAVMVSCLEGNINGLLDQVRRHISIDEDTLRLEAVSLGSAAAHFGVFSVFDGDSLTFGKFKKGFFDTLRVQSGLRTPPDAVLRTVCQRGEEYAGALAMHSTNEAIFKLPPEATTLRFSDNPAENAGKLFAYFCGAPLHPLVVMAGTALFHSTFEASQDTLSEMGLVR